MTAIIRTCLHVIFILVAIVASVFIVSLVSVFAVGFLIALSAYFFLVRKYSLLIETNE
jgi:hypothetical protein